MNRVSSIAEGKQEESETWTFTEKFRVNTDYRFGKVTFKELEDVKNHPPEVQRATRSLRERLENCPDIAPDFPCYFYILNSEDQIMCSIKALPDTLWIGSKKYPWAWMGAIFTEEIYRRKGFAAKITEESRRILHKQGIGRGGVFSTEIALHILKKLDFSFPGYVNRYLMVKSARPFLDAHMKSKFIVDILDRISIPIFRSIYQYYFGWKKADVLDVKLVDLNGKDFSEDQLRKIEYRAKYHFNEGLEKLLWKVKGSNAKPENHCSLYLLNDIENGDSICYFAIRLKRQLEPLADKYKNFKLMTLMEFGLFKNDERIYPTMLKEVINLFWNSDAQVLEIISNEKGLIKILTKKGLIKVGKGMSYTFSVPEGWHLGKESNELSNWHLTSFCGDAFSF